MIDVAPEIDLAAITSVGELFSPPDVNAARRFFAEKPRLRVDKRMTVAEAVTEFVHDGAYVASGG